MSKTPDHFAVRDAMLNDHQNPIYEDDIVVAVMGLTGAGKSSFINEATGRTEALVGNNLRSQTRTVQTVRCPHPDGIRSFVLVDTPGFDDTDLSDVHVLKIIAHWLQKTYRNRIKLSGLLYLHRISDVRMKGTPLRNLSVFKDLCGDNNMGNVVLVTTMWDQVLDGSTGSEREKQLCDDFWKDMIRLGSRTCRFEGTQESAWEIINQLCLEGSRQHIPLQIQEEMVDRGMQLHETTAAKTLFRFLAQLVSDLRRGWGNLRKKARRVARPTEPPNGSRVRNPLSRFPSTTSSSSEASRTTISSFGSSNPSSPSTPASTTSTSSDCSDNGRRNSLSTTIKALSVAHQMADISHIPMLRGIIGTVLRIAQQIQEMDGTHHAITRVVESSGWLLEEITQYAARSKLSKDMKRALDSFQRQLGALQKTVNVISNRGRITRFFLHDADLQTITACTAAINVVYDKLGVKLAMENRQAITRLEAHLKVLRKGTELRQCECWKSTALTEEPNEDGRPSTSTNSTS